MLSKSASLVASPVARINAQVRPRHVEGRRSVRVYAEQKTAAPDASVTPDEILACMSALLVMPVPSWECILSIFVARFPRWPKLVV
jgi:hypothetical protein